MRFPTKRNKLLAGGIVVAALAGSGALTFALDSPDHARLTAAPAERTIEPTPTASSSSPALTPTPTPSTTAAATPPAAGPQAVAPAPRVTKAPKKTTSTKAGQAAPQGVTAANVPGWRLVFADDFSGSVGLGQFAHSSYGPKYYTYTGGDSSGVGTYDTSQVISVGGGVLDMWLHTANNQALSAAIVPQVPGSGQTYGRYEVRFRADPMQDYGAAFLLWPDSNVWNEGEIDFPESSFTGTMMVHNHCIGHTQNSCYDVNTGVTWNSWHTAVTEWTPAGVTFYLDGRKVGQSSISPSTKMHMVLQTGTEGRRPAAGVQGHVQIDSIKIWELS
jgi:hypothetical protein